MHECAEVEVRGIALCAVVVENRLRLAARHAIDEGLAVDEHALHLHRDEQLLVALGWGQAVGHAGKLDGGGDVGHCS